MNAQIHLPTVFRDDIALRAKALRFRGVGNPYTFLDGIGILPITEFLYRGANIIDVADALNLPINTLHNWIANNNYGPEFEEASVLSAEGYIFRGEQMLREAKNKFELDKAKIMLEHGRFMAGKKNKKVYGTTQDVGAGQASVNYIFNVGSMEPLIHSLKNEEAIDAEFNIAPTVTLNLADEFLAELGPVPDHIPEAKRVNSHAHVAHSSHPSPAKEVENAVPRVETPRGKDTW